MARRSAGCGRLRWLAPSGYLSRTQGRHGCLWLLWLGPLWLREADCSDVLCWRSLALLGRAFASPSLQSLAEEVALVGGIGAVVVGAAVQRVLHLVRLQAEVAQMAGVGAVVVGAEAQRTPQKVLAGSLVEALGTESSGFGL